MTVFNDREREFEAKFAHDQELGFRVKTRRNGLLGYWAAEHLGIDPKAAQEYALATIDAQFHPHGDDSVVAKLVADFAAKGAGIDEVRVRDEAQRLLSIAKKQIMAV